MSARFYGTLAVSSVLVALVGCAGGDDTVTPPPADTGIDVAVEAAPADTNPVDTSVPDAASDSDTAVDAGPCGNGFLNVGEQCDDGNNTPGDGCDATCMLESTGPADLCPGEKLVLVSTSEVAYQGTVSGDTSTANGNYTSNCGGGLAKDLVYTFEAPFKGKAKITLAPEYAAVVSVRTDCKEAATELLCLDQSTPKVEPLSFTFEVSKASLYSIIVDGYGGATGKFKLDVEVLGEKCGNGQIDGEEQCEDGNTVSGDGCGSNCRLENSDLLTACPGTPFTFKTGGPRTLKLANTLNTSGSTDIQSSGCWPLSQSYQNHIYNFTSEYSATMHLDLANERGNVSLYARSECAALGIGPGGGTTEFACVMGGGPWEKLPLDVAILPGRTYTLVVDSGIMFDKPNAGRYTLDVSMVAPKCGNGIVETGEEWDDGNVFSGDGVTADCKLEPMWVADKCSTTPSTMPALTLAAQSDGSYTAKHTGTTAAATGGDFKTCPTTSSGPQSPDVVYRLRSPIDGLAKVSATGKFTVLLSAFKTCVDSLAQLAACDDPGNKFITFPVTKDVDMFVVVDSRSSAASGPYSLDVLVTPPVCGNGVVEGTETCDDKNTSGGDGCSATCALEPVTAHEKCADAELVTLTDTSGTYKATVTSGLTNLTADQTIAPCTSAGKDAVFKIVAPIDGVLTAKVIANFDAALGVREGVCTDTGAAKRCSEAGPTAIEEVRIAAAKDGVYYVVVDSVTSKDVGTFTLDLAIAPSKCGDGIPGGGEQCDDGNTTAGDGCSATCTLEPLAGVDTCPGYTVPFVADGTTHRAVVTVDTSKLNADYASLCGGAARDGVVSLTPPINGKALVEVLENDRVLLYTRSTCTDATTLNACSTKKLEFPVAAGKPFSLFLDGPPGVEGPTSVRVTVTP